MFKVYGKNSENVIYLELVEDDGGVKLLAVDENGDEIWIILIINDDGTLYLCSGINEDNEEGIQVDKDGRILIEE